MGKINPFKVFSASRLMKASSAIVNSSFITKPFCGMTIAPLGFEVDLASEMLQFDGL